MSDLDAETQENLSKIITDMHEEIKELPLESQLAWALAYRAWQKGETPENIPPLSLKPTPPKITYKLCKSTKKNMQNGATNLKVVGHKVCPPADWDKELINRSMFTQVEYMEMLAQCGRRKSPGRCKKKKSRKSSPCECKNQRRRSPRSKNSTGCSVRLEKMATPNKRYVLSNWKTYQNFLPPETLLRFNDILLTTEEHLKIPQAQWHFDQLDKSKNKKRKANRRRSKFSQRQQEQWLKHEILHTSESLVQFFRDKPVPILSTKQLYASDQIRLCLYFHRFIKNHSRHSGNHYEFCVAELCDKVISWVDSLYKIVEGKPLDSREVCNIEAESLAESDSTIYSQEEDEGEEEVEYDEREEEEEEFIDNFEQETLPEPTGGEFTHFCAVMDACVSANYEVDDAAVDTPLFCNCTPCRCQAEYSVSNIE